jgi:hypothetical protein|tara:strand:+ start:5727 stop:6575 length:849 start_codon:yes stop_codon:yes gene_type:complete
MENDMGNLETVENEFAISISDDKNALLAALGQDGVAESRQSGPSSLRINYDADTEEGHTLKRGTWKVYNGTEMVYADSVFINPMLRTYEYSIYDQEEGAFTCRSVQRKKMTETFPDNSGGFKCGRLVRSEEESLTDDDPRLLLSKSVTCNIIVYGQLDMPNAVNAAGEASPVENLPFVGYFKRSGFRPINDFVQQKLGNKIPLPTAYIELKTKRMANGGVTYWIPQPELVKEVQFTPERKELMQKFYDTVAAANSKLLGEHKDAVKQNVSNEDIDLANRLAG